MEGSIEARGMLFEFGLLSNDPVVRCDLAFTSVLRSLFNVGTFTCLDGAVSCRSFNSIFVIVADAEVESTLPTFSDLMRLFPSVLELPLFSPSTAVFEGSIFALVAFFVINSVTSFRISSSVLYVPFKYQAPPINNNNAAPPPNQKPNRFLRFFCAFSTACISTQWFSSKGMLRPSNFCLANSSNSFSVLIG